MELPCATAEELRGRDSERKGCAWSQCKGPPWQRPSQGMSLQQWAPWGRRGHLSAEAMLLLCLRNPETGPQLHTDYHPHFRELKKFSSLPTVFINVPTASAAL
uniref:Uncharacterized protein n=1 Tax=Micrurus surinamensis TaxID=129470 RepID=A0A2D4P3V7_MICSU